MIALDPTDAVRRDRWGRYLVVPPDGGKPVGYTRATTVAKALDEAMREVDVPETERIEVLHQFDDLIRS